MPTLVDTFLVGTCEVPPRLDGEQVVVAVLAGEVIWKPEGAPVEPSALRWIVGQDYYPRVDEPRLRAFLSFGRIVQDPQGPVLACDGADIAGDYAVYGWPLRILQNWMTEDEAIARVQDEYDRAGRPAPGESAGFYQPWIASEE